MIIYDENKWYQSYFNINGYELFLENTLPLITEGIDEKFMKIEKVKINEDKIEKAREFCSEVKKLAKQYNLSFFVVTEGASAISNNGCEAVKHARDCHIEWEKQHNFNPFEDWSKEIFNFKISSATINDLERIKSYKLKTIIEYSKNLSKEEMAKIDDYVCESVPNLINDYKNIIYNDKIIGSFLLKKINEGSLLDEIFIEEEYRNKGIGTSIIKNYIIDSDNNIYLFVYKDNIKAFNLYKRLGFEINEETDSRYYMKYKNTE